ncbi:heme NO-binding domain-containing protein [Haloarchaeobius sp. HRN-SO-5]|uniref:heme NO-binding domain-containing protein n=1 Tax=Haloarchaeobius sp. HRN-SO-5 TaxID=3446118 RepID=UPI003EBFC3F9
MHGIVLKGLKDHIKERYGTDTWGAVNERANTSRGLYIPLEEYPDTEAYAIVSALARETGADPATLKRRFGRQFASTLLETYDAYCRHERTGLDLLTSVDDHLATALPGHVGEVQWRWVSTARLDQDRVVLAYHSEYPLCSVVRGLVDGVGDAFGEEYRLSRRRCREEGGSHCELVVERLGRSRRTSG